MLDNIIVELAKRLKTVHTLSSWKENVISKVDENGIYVETESSRTKYQSGSKAEPYEFISFRFILDGWHELVDFRMAEANDFKKVKGELHSLWLYFRIFRLWKRKKEKVYLFNYGNSRQTSYRMFLTRA